MTLSMNDLEFSGLLYRYFSLSGNVSIPGVGALTQTRIAAVNEFIGRRMIPPYNTMKFNPGNHETSTEQTDYIGYHSGKDRESVLSGLRILGEALLKHLQVEKKLEWKGIGIFSIAENGEILFLPNSIAPDFFSPVEYVHVLRKNAEHSIIVGDGERTSSDMEVFFEVQRTNAGKNKWQKAALMLLIVSALLLLMRFTIGSFDLLESRYNPLKFTTPAPTYRAI